MNSNDRTHDHDPADLSAGAESSVDAVGAYLLDSLDEADVAAFEAYLRDDPDLRSEVALLRPVVDLLPLMIDLDEADIPAPSPNLRDRILLAVRDEDDVAATPPLPPIAPLRPTSARDTEIPPLAGRGRSGEGGLLAFVRRIGIERMAAGLLALVAAGAIIWALSLQSQLNEREDELAALQNESLVVAFGFNSTADGPAQASGALSILPGESDAAVLHLSNMPAIAEDQVYQTWFLDLDEAGQTIAARPGTTFRPDETGTVDLADVPFDQPFDAVGITLEPDGGSQTPTMPVLMFGTESFAQG